MSLRVLFAIPQLDRGGPDRVFHELIRILDRRRAELALVSAVADGYYASELPSDVPHYTLGAETNTYRRYPVHAFARLVWRVRPDIVFSTLRMNQTALLAKPLLPRGTALIPRVANQLNANFDELIKTSPIKYSLAKWLVRRSLCMADEIICQSQSMREDVVALTGRRVSVKVIGNPIDVGLIQARARAMKVTLPGRPSFVSVGRLTKQKGFDLLLRAVALVARSIPDLHLTIIGDGPDEQSLRALAEELDLSDRVTFVGFLENPYPHMAAADWFVSSSRYEGFSNALLESLACGVPAVATACAGATREMVVDGLDGLVVAPNSAEALASGLLRAAQGPGLDAAAISTRCSDRFGSSRIGDKYCDVFEAAARANAALKRRHPWSPQWSARP